MHQGPDALKNNLKIKPSDQRVQNRYGYFCSYFVHFLLSEDQSIPFGPPDSPLEVSQSLHLTVPVLLGLGQFALVLSLQLGPFLLSRSRHRRHAFYQVFTFLPRLRLSVGGRFFEQLHASPGRAQDSKSQICRYA